MINSEIAILRSRPVLQRRRARGRDRDALPGSRRGERRADPSGRAAREQRGEPAESSEKDDPTMMLLYAQAAERLGESITAQALPETDVLSISFQHPDPIAAENTVRQLVGRFIEAHLEAYGDREIATFLDQRVGRVREATRRSREEAAGVRDRARGLRAREPSDDADAVARRDASRAQRGREPDRRDPHAPPGRPGRRRGAQHPDAAPARGRAARGKTAQGHLEPDRGRAALHRGTQAGSGARGPRLRGEEAGSCRGALAQTERSSRSSRRCPANIAACGANGTPRRSSTPPTAAACATRGCRARWTARRSRASASSSRPRPGPTPVWPPSKTASLPHRVGAGAGGRRARRRGRGSDGRDGDPLAREGIETRVTMAANCASRSCGWGHIRSPTVCCLRSSRPHSARGWRSSTSRRQRAGTLATWIVNPLYVLREFGWDLLRGRIRPWKAFFTTTWMFRRMSRLARRFVARGAFDADLPDPIALRRARSRRSALRLHRSHPSRQSRLSGLRSPHASRRALARARARAVRRCRGGVHAQPARVGVAREAIRLRRRSAWFASVPGATRGSRTSPPHERDSQPPRILFVGVDWERKGGPELIEAFARVRASTPTRASRSSGVARRSTSRTSTSSATARWNRSTTTIATPRSSAFRCTASRSAW